MEGKETKFEPAISLAACFYHGTVKGSLSNVCFVFAQRTLIQRSCRTSKDSYLNQEQLVITEQTSTHNYTPVLTEIKK